MADDKKYEYKTKPFHHQIEALKKSAYKKNFAYFMEMGCFDEDTEFLTQRGWVKFADFDLEEWECPLLVAQAIPENEELEDWAFEFVEPISYIQKPAKTWYTMTCVQGTKARKECNVVVSEGHTFPMQYFNYTQSNVKGGRCIHWHHPVKTPMPMATPKYMQQSLVNDPRREPVLTINGLELRLPSAMSRGLLGFDSKFYKENELCKLNEWEIRFMVAVMADGTYPNKKNDKVDFYFTKTRKARRIEYLAERAGIPLACEKSKKAGKTLYIYHAIAPARYKIYTEEWYSLPQRALRWIAEEVWFWDGSVNATVATFFSVHKESIDFIQYACAACGFYTKIRYDLNKKIWILMGSDKKCSNPDLIARSPIYKDNPHHKNYDKGLEASTWCNVKKVDKDKIEKMSYCFRVPSGYLVMRRDNMIFISGNSGKTKVMIDNIAVLQMAGHITGALVLAPKGVYRNWSEKEIPTHLPDNIDREILVWKADATDTAKNKLIKQIEAWDGKKLQFLVFNIESLISEKGKKVLDAFVKKHAGNIYALVDESTCIKNHKAKRTKAAIALGKKCKVKRIATGSPVTNSPLDLFSQCAFLDTSLLGCGSFYAFKNTYADTLRVQNRQGQHYEKILSYKNLDKLSEMLNRFSFRVTKKECLDLPDKIYTTRDVELTPEQLKVYKEMADYQFALLKKEGKMEEMSAQVVLTKLLRLHQVLCGSFVSDDGVITRLPNNRIAELDAVLSEAQGKVIIWATYIPDIQAIEEMLKATYGPESYVTYYGATKPEDRVKAIELFQDESSPVRFFLGNVQTAGRGITLTAASTVVYYSNNHSLEFRQQSEDRAHRVGQKNNVTYVDLVVRGSLDEKIIKSLINKRNLAQEILQDNDIESWISLSAT